jgi:CheY-like chemotaxis protein
LQSGLPSLLLNGTSMTNDFCILLVEDDENDIFFFQRAAREAAIHNHISIARDGAEAVEYLAGSHKFADRLQYPVPCLVILDLKMPRKTGLEVLHWLRTQSLFKTIPVIVFSSSGQPEDIERAYRLGANAFVIKPPSLEKRTEFAKLVKGFWLHHNQPPGICRSSPSDLLQTFEK